MAIFGWESVKQAELYTREANRVLLAGDAMHLLVARKAAVEHDGNESGPPSQEVSAGGPKPAPKLLDSQKKI